MRLTTAVVFPLALLFSQAAVAQLQARDVASSEEGIKLVKQVSDPSRPEVPSQAARPVVEGVGTKDAPVDGKDGRPHSGPFVETSAERDRKKAKEDGVPLPKASSKSSIIDDTGKVPASNDGVMDDRNRKGPKEGTRGTEGGISEKTKDSKDYGKGDAEKVPDAPKEAPPLPATDQQSLKDPKKDDTKKGADSSSGEHGKKGDDGTKDGKAKEKDIGLEKPDLSRKPHDIPPPVPPTSSHRDPLAILKPYAGAIPMLTSATSSSIVQPLHSFVLSLAMIVFSEIGDKTFLIAALMAMKHPRLVVFSAAFSALITMTVLSAILGHAFPLIVPKRFVNLAAAALFLIFGLKMLREGYAIKPDQGVSAEMREVEMELEEKEQLARQMGRRSSWSPYLMETGRSGVRIPAPPDSPPSPDSRSPSPERVVSINKMGGGVNNLFSLLLSPAWVQTFIMTFLGEWGDRSQIATIAMAAGSDYWWVTGGAVFGHGICTAMAVIGGRAVAGRVSLRLVTLGGGFAFLVFGIIYLIEAMYIS